jgi:hypothetical protein
MRAILIMLLATAAPTYAVERTWTISTGSYAMAAELVEIRGDIAYLKSGDRIEQIPLVRLSAADMQYIESLSPSAGLTAPSAELPPVVELPAAAGDVRALLPSGPILKAPAPVVRQQSLKPVSESTARQADSFRATTAPALQTEGLLPAPPSTGQRTSPPRRVAQRASSNLNVRRPTAPQTQNRNGSGNRNRSRSEERTGLFGRRSRRFGN